MNPKNSSMAEVTLFKEFEKEGMDFHKVCTVFERLELRELIKLQGYLLMLTEQKLKL